MRAALTLEDGRDVPDGDGPERGVLTEHHLEVDEREPGQAEEHGVRQQEGACSGTRQPRPAGQATDAESEGNKRGAMATCWVSSNNRKTVSSVT